MNAAGAGASGVAEQGGALDIGRAAALLAGQNRALELIAGNAPLPEVLDFVTRLIEAHAPGLLCSVLLLEDGRLRHGAAPSLPEAYNRIVDGVAIGPAVGSCGTAAYRGRQVVVTDIATDPLWAGYAGLALPHGLRACWSTPIVGEGDEVLGTFAIYYRAPQPPPPEHLHLVEVATRITGIAIERRRKDAALAERARQLVEAGRRKDEFLALLAHELRNPLAPIVSALGLMRRAPHDAAAVERYLGLMERQVHALTRLVDDLLDVSRMSRGMISLRKERVTVASVIAAAVEASRPLIERRRHALATLVPDEPIEIEADPVRMAQVLTNLLNNAAKYTEPGGHIDVSAAREGDEVVIRVRDDGIGIQPDMLEHVFDLFVQADTAPSQASSGLGIGLTLVRTLVEMHGGRVNAESEGRGRGTTVIVCLPAAPEPGARASASSASAPSAAGARLRRVLIVDDNVDAADTLAEVVRGVAAEVEVVYDGPAAVAAACSRRPDTAIVDIGLPGMDGCEVARRLRAACDRAIRLVALSGYGQESDQRRVREAGFDVHLVKPADLDQILRAVSGAPPEPPAPANGGGKASGAGGPL
jgi:signal transduction histidine kinase/ActR/RegA family two-component response regulator